MKAYKQFLVCVALGGALSAPLAAVDYYGCVYQGYPEQDRACTAKGDSNGTYWCVNPPDDPQGTPGTYPYTTPEGTKGACGRYYLS